MAPSSPPTANLDHLSDAAMWQGPMDLTPSTVDLLQQLVTQAMFKLQVQFCGGHGFTISSPFFRCTLTLMLLTHSCLTSHVIFSALV